MTDRLEGKSDEPSSFEDAVILGVDGGATSTVCVCLPLLPLREHRQLPNLITVLSRAAAGCSYHNSVGACWGLLVTPGLHEMSTIGSHQIIFKKVNQKLKKICTIHYHLTDHHAPLLLNDSPNLMSLLFLFRRLGTNLPTKTKTKQLSHPSRLKGYVISRSSKVNEKPKRSGWK